MTSSCSFRITRTAEDLAQTIAELSQRLVNLEQRQEALELQLDQQNVEPSDEETKMLDGVELLLRDCQDLLEISPEKNFSEKTWSHNQGDEEDDLAA